MQFFIWRCKNFLGSIVGFLLALGILGCVYVGGISRFSALTGKRTFYLDSPTSQGLQTEQLTLSDVWRIKGESVYFSLPEGIENMAADGLAKKIAAKYHAEIVYVEAIGGVTSYYCHTLDWADGIILYGRKINLHIAVSEGRCAVGSPIVFGGF